jgi:hypothetical protein
VSSPDLPDAFLQSYPRLQPRAPLDGLDIGPLDRLGALDHDAGHASDVLQELDRGIDGGGDVDDEPPGAGIVRGRGKGGASRHAAPRGEVRRHGRFDEAEMGHAIVDVLAVAADAVLAVAELLPPVQQVLARPRRLHAQLLQLRRREGEQGVPGRDLGGVGRETAADGGQEGGVVGDEGDGLGDGPQRYLVVQTAGAGPGGRRCGGKDVGDKGSSGHHRGVSNPPPQNERMVQDDCGVEVCDGTFNVARMWYGVVWCGVCQGE